MPVLSSGRPGDAQRAQRRRMQAADAAEAQHFLRQMEQLRMLQGQHGGAPQPGAGGGGGFPDMGGAGGGAAAQPAVNMVRPQLRLQWLSSAEHCIVCPTLLLFPSLPLLPAWF